MKIFRILRIFVLTLVVILFAFVFLKDKDFLKFTRMFPQNLVSVYFTKVIDQNDEQILPVKRKIIQDKSKSRLKFAIEELLKGPTLIEQRFGYFTEIPEKTILLGIKETPEKIIINLSKDFEAGGGSQSMTLRLKQVIYTSINSVENKSVYLELNGKQVNYIGGEGVEVPYPLAEKN
ncbi:MAG: GerMN domain-containing protein [bacterium]